jgi:PAS domain S-box-containing protein
MAFSFRHKKKNGEIRDVEVFSAPVVLDGQRLLHSIIQDVTERKRAEDALREKTEELDQYFSTSLDLFCIADTEGYFRRLNAQWERSLGYTLAELEGRRFLDFVHPDDMQATLDAISDLTSQKEVLNFTNRYRHRDGTYRWIEWRSFPKGDRIFAAARDITDRKRIEDALRESEEKYRTLVESSFDGIAIHQDGILVYVNQTAAQILGAPDPGVFIGVPAIDIVAPAFRERIAERVKLAPGNALGLIREQFVLRDGSLIDVDVTTAPSTWKGRPAAYVTFRDITAQARAENALRESEEKYRAIIDDMQDIFYRTDPEGKITMLSPSAARLAGYDSNDQLVGQDVISVYVDPAGRGRLLATLRERGSVYAYPLILRTRDGTSKHVTTSSHFYRDSHGNILGVEGVIHDISDQKQAEDALRRSEERYRTIIENIQDVYFRFDKEGHLIMVSPSAARTFGYNSAAEMLGCPAASIWKNLTERAQMIDTMRAHGGAVQDWEAEFVKKDGTAFWASVSGRLHMDEQGEFDGTEGIIRDISERKKMEGALKSTLTKLNMLSSITRHDILNQIMGLRTFLELSREDLKGTRFAEFIEKEDQAAEAIQRQIEFTKFYQDIGVNAPDWQDVAAVVRAAASQLNLAAIKVNVTVTGVEIFADPLIEKVFYNLLENSLRHGERVTTMEFSSRKEEAGLVITYRDNGVGIPAGDKEKLFQKGFGKHTGLGLFLSREILAITGITITENGEPGAGVRFEITVPKDAYRYIA